jgi:osmoprotectant transport system permease protein
MFETLKEVGEYITANRDAYVTAVWTHLSMSFFVLLVSCAIGIGLGVVSAKKQSLSNGIVSLFNTLKMIPSLAIMLAIMPILGTGFWPAFLALSLHAIPVVLINTYSGFKNISSAILEIAEGLGLSRWEILIKIETPLALPLIFTGIRTGMVDILASATLVAYIGAGGLGVFIISGLSFMNFTIMMTGALSIAVLVIAIDIVLAILQKKLIWYQI